MVPKGFFHCDAAEGPFWAHQPEDGTYLITLTDFVVTHRLL